MSESDPATSTGPEYILCVGLCHLKVYIVDLKMSFLMEADALHVV